MTLLQAIRDISKKENRIEKLQDFLNEQKEIVIDEKVFKLVLSKEFNVVRNGIIYLILYHCIKCDIVRSEVGDKLSFENVISILDKAIHRFITPEDFHRLINFQDQSGNTLLHQAVINNKTKVITTILKCGADPLIKNANGEIPLDLAEKDVVDPATEEKTREVLIESMEKQASSNKWSAVHNSSFGIIPGVFLGVGLGISGALAGPSMAIMLGQRQHLLLLLE